MSLGPAFWDKQKPALAKAARPPVSKLGEELKTLGKLHLGIDWSALGDDKLDSVDKVSARVAQLDDAAKGRIKALAEQAQTVETAALKFETEAKKDKAFPKEPLAALATMVKATKDYRAEVDEFVAAARKSLAARATALAAQKAKAVPAPGASPGAESKAAKLVRTRGLDAIRRIRKPVPGAPPLRFLVVQGKTSVATYMGPAVGPTQEGLLKGLIPTETPFKTFKDPHGVLVWEKNAVTFVSDVLPAGVVKKMQLWLRKLLKLNLKLRVRRTDGAVEESEGEEIAEEMLEAEPLSAADRNEQAAEVKQRLLRLQPEIQRALRGASAEEIRQLLASIGQHDKNGSYDEAEAGIDEIEALLEPGDAAAAPAATQGAAPDAAAATDAMALWKTRRAAALTSLKAVASQIAEAKHPASGRAILELQAVIKNLTAEPSSLQQVKELKTWLASDEVVADVCEMAEDIRAPLLPALEGLRATLRA